MTLLRSEPPSRVERGDWQTPPPLARQVVALLQRRGVRPAAVVEPTCGRGAFVAAALDAFPDARVLGFELSAVHLADARAALAGTRAELHPGDFFHTDWDATFASLPGPLLLLGNPPWVTSATLGALGSDNLPAKANAKRHAGLDARTGKANFDLSEWMITRLIEAARGRPFTLAMLCKSSVARRLLETATARGWALDGALHRIDAKAHFDAAVDAALLVVTPATGAPWDLYNGLDEAAPARRMGVVDGALTGDLDALLATRSLAGTSEVTWRSGVKHDCAAVMELERRDGSLVNGLGERVEVEREFVFPMLKGSDVANGRPAGARFMIVTQRRLGDDTPALERAAPRLWRYLSAHRQRLDARASSIYEGKGPFAVFGVGAYTFAPHKVAVCGLYKRLRFTRVDPYEATPVVLDDTSYFLPCETAARAEALARALNGERARAFFEARVFWDAKRPVNKALLQALSLEALLRAEGHPGDER